MILSVDIDDTLIKSEFYEGEYINAKPMQEEIINLNALYGMGYTIILYTGRHWNHYEITKKQLKDFGIKYHELVMGKIPCEIIDDKSYKSITEFCQVKGFI
jgi:hypothetical protein